MTEVPDQDDIVSFPGDDRADRMPAATERAFRTHSEAELRPSGKVERAMAEIEDVFDQDANSAVAVSGGKDSMAALALASRSDARHRALHWDWGPRLVPRAVERELVSNIRSLVPDDRLYVGVREAPTIRRWPDASRFREALSDPDGIASPDGSLGRLAGALRTTDHVGTQVVGLRAGESGSRDRSLDGLYGQSLGQPAAFPLRSWSARDIWAYLVSKDIPYPDHYDRIACEAGDRSPEAYESARFTTFFDPEFEALSGSEMGVAAWDHQDVLR